MTSGFYNLWQGLARTLETSRLFKSLVYAAYSSTWIPSESFTLLDISEKKDFHYPYSV